MYGLIILLNQQHRNLTFLIELRGASFYDELTRILQKKKKKADTNWFDFQVLKEEKRLLRNPYQRSDAPAQLLQYRDRSWCQKQETSLFSCCIHIWKETFLLQKGSWVRSPSGCQDVEGSPLRGPYLLCRPSGGPRGVLSGALTFRRLCLLAALGAPVFLQ